MAYSTVLQPRSPRASEGDMEVGGPAAPMLVVGSSVLVLENRDAGASYEEGKGTGKETKFQGGEGREVGTLLVPHPTPTSASQLAKLHLKLSPLSRYPHNNILLIMTEINQGVSPAIKITMQIQ